MPRHLLWTFVLSLALSSTVLRAEQPPVTSDAKKPDAKKPEAKKPEAKKPEAKKPEAKKPDAPPRKEKATKADFVLSTSATTATIKLNGDGLFALQIEAKNGLKIHPDAPIRVQLQWPKGIIGAKDRLGHADLKSSANNLVELQTPVHGIEAGKYDIPCDVSFFLCEDTWCQRMHATTFVAINVVK